MICNMNVKNYNMTKYLITSFLTCIFGIQANCQSPFNYGQNEDVYFLSTEDINYYGISVINDYYYEYKESNGVMIYLTQLQFSDGAVTLHSLQRYDTIEPQSIEDVLETVEFNNGSNWNFIDDRATYIGGDGYGTICGNNYEIEALYSKKKYFCELEDYEIVEKNYFNANGLPEYLVCCTKQYYDDEFDEMDKEVVDEPLDTTYLVYDDLWRYIGYIENGDTVNIIDEFLNHKSFYNREVHGGVLTISKTYIEEKLGCIPNLIFMEIYKNAVLIFKYSDYHENYDLSGSLSLESSLEME